MGEDAVGEAFKDVMADAEEALAQEFVGLADFKSFARGSEPTNKAKGVHFDTMRGEAESTDAIGFCRDAGLKLSRSCDIKKHGELDDSALANEWCRRMQRLLNEASKKKAGAIDGRYEANPEFHAWYDELPKGS